MKSYKVLTDELSGGDTMFPVRYELGFYISGDGILHSDRLENLRP
jgi:hypothetical protein